jgi:hypothetical protein
MLVSLTLAAAVLATAACDDGEGEVAVYSGMLTQINPQLARTLASATVEIIVERDELMEVDLQGVGLDPVDHPTFLRAGGACPTQAADLNSDGFIDAIEGQAVYGSALLPLDSDVTTQSVEAGTFPSGTDPRYFTVEDYDEVLEAVSGPDSPNDFLVSLVPGEPLALDRRTVVVHGVGPALIVEPHDVKGLDGMPVAASVPILCGQLTRVS